MNAQHIFVLLTIAVIVLVVYNRSKKRRAKKHLGTSGGNLQYQTTSKYTR